MDAHALWERELPVAAFGTVDADPLRARLLMASENGFPPLVSLRAAVRDSGLSYQLQPPQQEAGSLVHALHVSTNRRTGARIALVIDPAKPTHVVVKLFARAPVAAQLATVAGLAVFAALVAVCVIIGKEITASQERSVLPAVFTLVGMVLGIPATTRTMRAVILANGGADRPSTEALVAKIVPVLEGWTARPRPVAVGAP